MTAFDLALVALLVALSLATLTLAWLIIWRHVQATRANIDVVDKAMKIQSLIDERVESRILQVRTWRTVSGAAPGPGEQPPMPQANVRQTSVLDEVREYERESERLRSNENEYEVRDSFATNQPPVEP